MIKHIVHIASKSPHAQLSSLPLPINTFPLRSAPQSGYVER